MESEDSQGVLYHSPTNVIIVPTSGHTSSQCFEKQQRKCRGCGSPVRGSPGRTMLIGSSKYDPANFLTRGGSRAADKANEEKLIRLNKAAMKDLKVANNTLAHELVRLQAHGSEEKQAMREDVARLEVLVQAQQEKMEVLKLRLTDALKQNEEAEEKHHARLKEVARRLKDDHLNKLRPLQEAHNQLLEELAEKNELLADKNESCSQLQQTREQLAKVVARLEVESASRAELWQRCSTVEQELQAARDKLSSTSRRLTSAEQQLEAALSLEPQLLAVEEDLKSERVEHTKLQADMAVERSQTATLRAEVERLKRDLAAVSKRADQLDAERSALKLEMADAQAVTADAGVEVRTARARSDRLEQELMMMRQEAENQAASLRSQAAAREERLNAQFASRLAQLQSELDARSAAAADSEAALTAAKTEIVRLTGQVESLRHMGDAAGSQLGASQARVDQLKQEKEELQQQVKQLEVQLMQREAAVSELLASHKSASQSWQEKHQQLAESAATWRQKAVELQEELEAKADQSLSSSRSHAEELARLQVMLDNTKTELLGVRKQLTESEDERTAASRRNTALIAQWEERDAAASHELAALRSQLSEQMGSSSAARAECDSLKQQLWLREQEVERLTLDLADEQARVAALRGQLGTIELEKAAEVETSMRNMQELSLALQAEQQARLDAQLELNRSKKKQSTIESELQQQKHNLSQVLEAKARAEEAAISTAAALSAAERKAKQYRYDSNTLLSDYDTWVQGLLAKKSSSGSGGAAPALGAGPTAATEGLMTQQSLSRASSQLASPSVQQQQQVAGLEKYDKIAALLESRGVGQGLTQSSSSMSIAAGRNSSSMAAAGGARLSPKPAFR